MGLDGQKHTVPNSPSWEKHPSACDRPADPAKPDAFSLASRITIPTGVRDATIDLGGCQVGVTNLDKPFWPELGITKRDLLQYYADISPVLLPHLADRAMVMKRYPHGAGGEFFFMKRAPKPRPEFIDLCTIEHSSGNVIDFPVIQDVASLLWVINLGCIDLNQWYGRCDSINQPDYLHFDLDPVPGATFAQVCETAILVRDALTQIGMQSYAKTSGSHGIHIYVPILRGPQQKEVWTFAKQFAITMAKVAPDLVTAEYKIVNRPAAHVLVDYNQNAWGRTLASVYSVRPAPLATVSTPVTWDEVEQGITIEQFTMPVAIERVARLGDLWAPVVNRENRFDLAAILVPKAKR